MMTAAINAARHNHHPEHPAIAVFSLTGGWWETAWLDVWHEMGNCPI